MTGPTHRDGPRLLVDARATPVTVTTLPVTDVPVSPDAAPADGTVHPGHRRVAGPVRTVPRHRHTGCRVVGGGSLLVSVAALGVLLGSRGVPPVPALAVLVAAVAAGTGVLRWWLAAVTATCPECREVPR